MKIKFNIHLKLRYLLIIIAVVVIFISYLIYFRQFEVLPDATIHLIDDIQLPKTNNQVLIFSPHPDDETLGIAGFIHQSIVNGAKVTLVIVTDGNKHGLEDRRYSETRKAMAILGLPETNIIFLGYPDGKLKEQKNLDQVFSEIIQKYQPNYILVPHPADTNIDHRITGQNLNQVIAEIKIKPIIYYYLVHYHRFPRPEGLHANYNLLPPAKLISHDYQWLKLALDPQTEDLKQEAILQYKTQLSRKNYLLRNLLFAFIRKNEIFQTIRD